MFDTKRPLGDILTSEGLLTTHELQRGLDRQEKTGQKLGEALLELGLMESEDLARALALQLEMPYVDLSEWSIDPGLASSIPAQLARRETLIPVHEEDDHLMVALANPLDVASVDHLRLKADKPVVPVVAGRRDIEIHLGQLYGDPDSVTGVIEQLTKDESLHSRGDTGDIEPEVQELVNQVPVVKLVRMILLEAVQNQASDVHLEAFKQKFSVRLRIDGVLHELTPPPKHLQDAVISRIKVMASLDIAENRLPQDGRLTFEFGEETVDFRVSTVPTVHGESVVLRMLGHRHVDLQIDSLGFREPVQERFKKMLNQSHGMILVCGPTGAGKTTTLYSALNHINHPSKKIITLEDPVEYKLPGLIQCQIREETGLSFARGLRSVLRQDPDVCLVGEIRSVKTARIAVQAALTGHLVLATVHTSTASGSLTRLVDMGLPPFLLTATVEGVLCQRLLRVICGECAVEYQPDPSTLKRLGKSPGPGSNDTHVRGRGCEHCHQTGFSGRVGIFELLELSERIQELIQDRPPAQKIQQQAVKEGMVTLVEDGWTKVLQNVTTAEELLRIAPVEGTAEGGRRREKLPRPVLFPSVV